MPAPPLPYRFESATDAVMAAFTKWEGPPPALVQPQLQTPSRAGQRNVGLIDTGRRLSEVEVNLTSWWADLATAYAAHNTHVALIGIIPLISVVWADIDLDGYNQKVLVKAVHPVECRVHPRFYAPKWELNYANGARLIEKFTLQYFEVDPPA